jgi:hypothetical protein
MRQDLRIYDRIGVGYARQRRAEPAWQGAIASALAGCRTVVNVGAGAGSYESEGCRLVAVEPSVTMIRQRLAGAGVRDAISGLALLDQAVVDDAMARLRRDLDSGTWQRRYSLLAEPTELDLGYRLVVARGSR